MHPMRQPFLGEACLLEVMERRADDRDRQLVRPLRAAGRAQQDVEVLVVVARADEQDVWPEPRSPGSRRGQVIGAPRDEARSTGAGREEGLQVGLRGTGGDGDQASADDRLALQALL